MSERRSDEWCVSKQAACVKVFALAAPLSFIMSTFKEFESRPRAQSSDTIRRTLPQPEAIERLKPERRWCAFDHFSRCSRAPRGRARRGAACASRPPSVRTLASVVTSSRDKESSTPTVSVHRWRSLSMTTTTSPSKAIITGKQRRSRSGHTTRARRRVGDARRVPYYLPGHHIAAAPRRKLTSGSCCARVSSALRVVRPAVVSVVAVRASGTIRVRITTSKEPRAG